MAYLQEGYISDTPAAMALPSERVAFIRKTYSHLAMAVLAFVGIEYALFTLPVGSAGGTSADAMMQALGNFGRGGMIALMIAFIGAGYAAQAMARSRSSQALQYAGLGGYVIAESIIFVPMLWIARHVSGDNSIIVQAGGLTIALFLGLSAAVIFSRADFSWMRTGLCVLSFVALGIIVVGWFTGFSLGLWFSGAMIALAAGFIVYNTSMILHHYPTSMYVSAALELFAAVALLFWYILRFAMQMSGNSRD